MNTPSQSLPHATDETALTPSAREPRPRSLMSKPQPLGFLPSVGFWHDLWRTEPQLHTFFTLLWVTVNAPLVFLILRYLPPSWLSLSLVVLLPLLSMGVVEKWLRSLIVRRRRQLAGARPPGEE